MNFLLKRFIITIMSILLMAALQMNSFAANECTYNLEDDPADIDIPFKLNPYSFTIRNTYIFVKMESEGTDALNTADFQLRILTYNSPNLPINGPSGTTVDFGPNNNKKAAIFDKSYADIPLGYSKPGWATHILHIIHDDILDLGTNVFEPWYLNIVPNSTVFPVILRMEIFSTDSEDFILADTSELICPPTLDSIGSQDMYEGECLVIPLSASDSDSGPLMFDANGPAMEDFCWLIDDGPDTGSILCCPSSSDYGSSDITVRVTNEFYPVLYNQERFPLTVGECHAPVLLSIGSQSVEAGANLDIPLLATDTDSSDTLTFEVDCPGFCELIDSTTCSDCLIRCTLDNTNIGIYTVTVTVTDNCGLPQSDSDVFNLTVWENFSPTLDYIGDYTGSESIYEGESLDIPLQAHDDNGDDTVKFIVDPIPPFCWLIDNGDGSGSIKCLPSYEDADTYTITVTVTDNGETTADVGETFDLEVKNKVISTTCHHHCCCCCYWWCPCYCCCCCCLPYRLEVYDPRLEWLVENDPGIPGGPFDGPTLRVDDNFNFYSSNSFYNGRNNPYSFYGWTMDAMNHGAYSTNTLSPLNWSQSIWEVTDYYPYNSLYYGYNNPYSFYGWTMGERDLGAYLTNTLSPLNWSQSLWGGYNYYSAFSPFYEYNNLIF